MATNLDKLLESKWANLISGLGFSYFAYYNYYLKNDKGLIYLLLTGLAVLQYYLFIKRIKEK